MSKFFATGDSDSESEVVSSDEEVQVDAGATGNRFVYSSSESEDEGKRVVRSEKDKRFDELRATMRQVKNHLKINDWTAVQKDFDVLTKQLEKAEKVLKKEGLPVFLLSTISQTEKAQKEQFENKALYKKMAAPNAKALNTMKQKIKKFISQYAAEFEKYAKNPVEEEEEMEEEKEKEKEKKKKSTKKVVKKKAESEEEDEDDDDDDDEEDDESEEEDRRVKFVKKPAKKKAASDDEDEDEDEDDEESDDESEDDKKKKKKSSKKKSKGDSDEESEEESEEEESSESSDSDADLDLASGKSAMFTREFWVKKDKESSSESDEEEEREERRRKKREVKKRKEEAKEQASVEQALRAGQEKGSGQEMSPEQVIKKLKELLAMRGKRGTDRLAMISDLKLLASKATEPAAQLKVHTTLASALFDVTLNKGTHMPTQLWQECAAEVNAIINLLNANPNVRLSEDERVEEQFEDDAKDSESLGEEEKRKVAAAEEQRANREQNEDLSAAAAADQVQYVMGNLFSFVQLLCIEFRRSLQAIDFHTEEYITRLRDETLLSELVGKAQDYYKKVGKTLSEANVAFLRLELIYYKYTAEQDILLKKITEEKEEKNAAAAVAAPESLVSQLATFLYKHGNDQSRVRALLMHVFHLALHNNWSVAREMLLMSHVHEAVNQTDIKTQVLFNRAMAQLGLAAFRNGEFRQCLDSLAELVQSNHMLELLAQGISNATTRWQDRDLEKEAIEKRRLYPFHMHLNKDFIEAAHLISAMLSEVPNLAVHGRGNRQKIISKVFRRLFEFHMKQAFTGPPENTRDLVMAATRALRVGDWEKCLEHLMRLRFWRLMPQQLSAHVHSQLKLKVQEEGLRTYLLSFSSSFTSISLPLLAAQFSLPEALVYRLTSKLMVNDQLAGAWDQPTQTIQLHAQNPTKLQKAALAFADKATLFVEQNERLLDSRQGFSQGFYKGSGGAAVERREKSQEEKQQRNDRDGGWVEGGRSRGGRGGRANKVRSNRGGARPNNRR